MSNQRVYSLQSPEVISLCESDKRLSTIICNIGELKYTPYEDPFCFIVETIIGQMLSNKVADVLSTRLTALCNGNICIENLKKLNIDELRTIGLSKQKSEFILNITSYIDTNPIFFDKLSTLPDEKILEQLTVLHGIGMWTAKMYLIFVLDRPDVLPYEDGAFLQVYRWLYQTDDDAPKHIQQHCQAWHPYSSLAARYMYRALDMGLLKKLDFVF